VGDKNGSKVAQNISRLAAWKELVMGQNSGMEKARSECCNEHGIQNGGV
jgi:hypothetical protein